MADERAPLLRATGQELAAAGARALLACVCLVCVASGCAQAHVDGGCTLPSGQSLAPGEHPSSDPCRVCDPSIRTDGLTNAWSAHCGGQHPVIVDAPPGAVDFGVSVELGSDADGDGRGDLLVGAPGDESSAGHAYLFSGATLRLLHRWDGWAPDDRFGVTLSLGPDVDGDGLADVVIQNGPLDGANYRGALYSGADGHLLRGWQAEASCQQLGATAELGPDIDGDGAGDLLISSLGDPVVEDVEGGRAIVDPATPPVCLVDRVMLISGRTGDTIRAWEVGILGPGLRLGGASFAPDMDGDGRADVAIARWVPLGGTAARGFEVVSSGTGDVIRTWDSDDGSFADAVKFGPDADGDGIGDAVAGGYDLAHTMPGSPLDTWFISGAGAPARLQTFGASFDIGPDADGDGLGDMVVCQGGLCDEVLLMSAVRSEPIARLGLPDGFFGPVSIGPDADGDGRADIAAADFTLGRVYMLYSSQ